ncbi:MAG: glycosyltransferase [Variovorax sp.]|nr:MAG: glycosyltransferase [Variovorax sp.]
MNECRILALLPFLVKGALSIEIFRAMLAKRLDVTVAYCDDTSALYPSDDMNDFRDSDHLIDLSRESVPSSLGVISKVIEQRNIDLIVQVGATNLYHHLSRWKDERPSLRIADILYNEFGHTLSHFLYERCIDGVIVESENMRDFVRRASFREAPPVEIVLSGVDLDWFTPSPDRAEAGPRMKLGYVGRMSSEKNPLGFIDLAERLLAVDPDLDFRMYGGGAESDAVRQRLAQSPGKEQITYGGFVDHSRTALHELDALILPSKFDGRPAIIMEANACGVPVIAAPVGGVPELIEHGINGFLAAPSDTESIHAVIANWKRAPESLAALKRSSREYATRHFDRQRMLDDYARAFMKVAST